MPQAASTATRKLMFCHRLQPAPPKSRRASASQSTTGDPEQEAGAAPSTSQHTSRPSSKVRSPSLLGCQDGLRGQARGLERPLVRQATMHTQHARTPPWHCQSATVPHSISKLRACEQQLPPRLCWRCLADNAGSAAHHPGRAQVSPKHPSRRIFRRSDIPPFRISGAQHASVQTPFAQRCACAPSRNLGVTRA
jgi:hypothetical protein